MGAEWGRHSRSVTSTCVFRTQACENHRTQQNLRHEWQQVFQEGIRARPIMEGSLEMGVFKLGWELENKERL